MKLPAHCASYSGIQLVRSTWYMRVGSTLSKALDRLRDKRIIIFFIFHAVCICSVRSSRAVSVERPSRAPIWKSGSSACASAASRKRFAAAASINLPTVLRRAMGLQALESLIHKLIVLIEFTIAVIKRYLYIFARAGNIVILRSRFGDIDIIFVLLHSA